VLAAESQSLADRRWALEARQRELSPRAPLDDRYVSTNSDRLQHALAHIRAYIDRSDDEGFQLLLRAVDAQIIASPDRAEIRGSVPIIDQSGESFATIEQTSA
jgi:hypothetical protein